MQLIMFNFQPHVDFGMRVSGGDIMSIPGIYRFVQVLPSAFIPSVFNFYLHIFVVLNLLVNYG